MFKLIFSKHGSKRGMRHSFYVMDNYSRIDLDRLIFVIGIDKKYYYDYLKTNFNSEHSESEYSVYAKFNDYGRPFFKNKKDCKKAIEWTEGLITIQTLTGEIL